MQGRGLITVVKSHPRSFAERLKWAREAAELSQGALARKAGVSQGAIGNYESGARDAPRDVLRLAESLGVSPRWLLQGVGLPHESMPSTSGGAEGKAQLLLQDERVLQLLDDLASLSQERFERAMPTLLFTVHAVRTDIPITFGTTPKDPGASLPNAPRLPDRETAPRKSRSASSRRTVRP
jgi:transcriptional regulator with XRE-family HTH domain